MGVPAVWLQTKRVLCYLLLSGGVAVGQHTIADGAQPSECSGPAQPITESCLPEAPSAVVRRPEVFTQVPLAAIAPRSNLSPAERPFVPLNGRQKFNRFLRSMYSPYTIFNSVYDATWDQATGGKARYGSGFGGWGDRLGSSLAATGTRQFFGTYFFPAMLRQDPRYFAMYHGSVWKRFVHAVSRTALTRGDDGHTQIDASTFLAIGATEMLQNTWLPPGDRGFDQTVNRIVGSFQGAATSHLLQEFSPDLLRIFKRHSPKRLRRIEDRIPEQMITGVPPDAE